MASLIKDIQDDIMLNTLEQCIEKCRHCDALVTVREYKTIPSTGETVSSDIKQLVATARNVITIDNAMFYLQMFPDNLTEMPKIYSLWETVRARGTKQFLDNKANDYVLHIDLISPDKEQNLVYGLLFTAPKFIGIEKKSLLLAFDIDNMYFSRDNVDFVEVYDEVQYAEKEEQAAYDAEARRMATYNENADILDNSDILGDYSNPFDEDEHHVEDNNADEDDIFNDDDINGFLM